jgi:hypothetical protein
MNLSIPYPEEGTYVIGGTGTRKSTLLLNLMVEAVRTGQAFAFFDPHRDLAPQVISHLEPSRRIVLDLHTGFGINLFGCDDPDNPQAVGRVLAQVQQAFAKLWHTELIETPLIADYLAHSVLPMILTGGTMETLRTFLDSGNETEALRQQILSQLASRYAYVRDFWRNHENLPSHDRQNNIGNIARRVRYFLSNPITGALFSQQDQSVDWRKAMDEGISVVVMLDPHLQAETNFVGAVLLGQILSALLSRADTMHRPPYGLYVDEYDSLATPSVADLFTQGRKYRIQPVIAHQHRGNLNAEMRRATLQVANVFALRVAPPDNEDLAGIFDTSPPEPETRGADPVRGPAPRVVSELITHGHRDEFIWSFAEGSLRPLQNHIDNPKPKNLHNFVTNNRDYLTSKESLRAGMAQIDHFLTLANAGRLPIHSSERGPLLAGIFTSLRAYFGLGEESRFLTSLDFNLQPWQTLSIARHEEEMETPVPVAFTHEHDLLQWMTFLEFMHSLWTPFSEVMEHILDNQKMTYLEWVRTLPRETIMDTSRFAWNLLTVAATLKKEPILISTGQYVELKERPRSRDDMRSQIANELAILPSGVARARIRIDKATSPDGRGFRFEEVEIPLPPMNGPHGFWSAPTQSAFNQQSTEQQSVFDDLEPVSPGWRWETISKPSTTSPQPKPHQRSGWHWEPIAKAAPPQRTLKERVQQELRDEPPPRRRRKSGPPPI